MSKYVDADELVQKIESMKKELDKEIDESGGMTSRNYTCLASQFLILGHLQHIIKTMNTIEK